MGTRSSVMAAGGDMRRTEFDINNQEFRHDVPWWALVVALLVAPVTLMIATAWCLYPQVPK